MARTTPSRRSALLRSSQRMSSKYVGFLILALTVLIGASGCVSTSFGEVTYGDGALQVHVEHTAGPVEDAVLQVTVVEVGALEQHEVFYGARYINLDQGENDYAISVDLEPGSYRVFLTIFVGQERRPSVIRDLEVAA